MPYYTKYHVREQSAPVLLGPIGATLRELEQRAQHYAERLSLEPGAAEALTAAKEAIGRARQEVERLRGQGAQGAGK